MSLTKREGYALVSNDGNYLTFTRESNEDIYVHSNEDMDLAKLFDSENEAITIAENMIFGTGNLTYYFTPSQQPCSIMYISKTIYTSSLTTFSF